MDDGESDFEYDSNSDGVITKLANSLRNIEISLFVFGSITFHYFLALMSHHSLVP